MRSGCLTDCEGLGFTLSERDFIEAQIHGLEASPNRMRPQPAIDSERGGIDCLRRSFSEFVWPKSAQLADTR